MSKASLELGGGNWAAKDGNLLGYAVGDTSGKYLPREFTFSRGADIAATRVNKDGLIEKYRENLIKSSNDFTGTGWTTAQATLLSGYSGYDGTNDAWFLRADSGANTFSRVAMLNTTSTGLSSTGLRTFSVYAKKKDYDYVGIYIQGSNKGVVFSLLDGTAVNSIISYPDIYSDGVEVGGGWWRFSISHTTTTSTTAAAIYACEAAAYDGNSNYGKGIYIQDAQFEHGLVATDYLESGSTTGKAGVFDDLPRIDYTGGTASLLLEPTRTNLVSNSEGIIAGSNAVTTTLNYGVAPDGTTSSLKVQKNGTTANERITIADDLAVLDASTYTVSGFVKNIDIVDAGVTTIGARVNAGTLFRQGYEWTGSSLATTSYGSNGSTSNTILEDYGNGWWRIGFTFTTDGTQLDFEIDIDRQNAVHTTSIETWGWQLEAFQVYDENDVLLSANGPFVTSYIPTYGIPTTRTFDYFADESYNDVLGNGDLSVFVDFDYAAPVREGYTTSLSAYSGNDVLGIKGSSYKNLQVYAAGNFSGEINFNAAEQATRIKALIRTNGTTVELFFNGAKDAETITFVGSLPYAWDEFRVTGSNSLLAKYNRIAIFTESLSDAECIALTTL
jgi:hypothetical protein